MKNEELEKLINDAFENREKISPNSDSKIIKAIEETINLLDSGTIRVANKKSGKWIVNQWIKKAIL